MRKCIVSRPVQLSTYSFFIFGKEVNVTLDKVLRECELCRGAVRWFWSASWRVDFGAGVDEGGKDEAVQEWWYEGGRWLEAIFFFSLGWRRSKDSD